MTAHTTTVRHLVPHCILLSHDWVRPLGPALGKPEMWRFLTPWATTRELIVPPMNYSRGAIFCAASFDVITGCTSKTTRSLQFAIH